MDCFWRDRAQACSSKKLPGLLAAHTSTAPQCLAIFVCTNKLAVLSRYLTWNLIKPNLMVSRRCLKSLNVVNTRSRSVSHSVSDNVSTAIPFSFGIAQGRLQLLFVFSLPPFFLREKCAGN